MKDLGVDPSRELQELEVKILNHDPDLAASDAGGRRLRGYRLGNRIGEGAYSIVYRATQPSIGREVAVKVIRKELANERDFIRRFEAEAQLVARLQHPRIVPLYDFWREADSAYLVMPWLEGSLAKRLRAGPLSLEETVRVVRHVAAGLDFAHNRGVIHRDVKPSNVLLDGEGNAYISDFGIALTEISMADEAPLMVSAGSPAYAAPEQFGDGSIGVGVDIYALAVMTYELLSGSLPWPESATTATLLQHHRAGLPPVQLAESSIEHAVNSILARATATDPTARPVSTTDFAAELAGTISSEPARPRATEAANPYRGLAAFEEPDAPFFFGREELIDTVVDKLRHEPLVLLVGPSGSGKSSLLHAGVIPILRSEGRLPVLVTPSADPIGSLAAALESVSTATSGSIRADLGAGTPLAAIAGRIAPGSPIVIAVDQMEELFTLADAGEAEKLLAVLATAATASHDNLRVLASIRADFFGHPLASPSFGAFAGPATVTIGPMRAEQLAAAISEPARLSGVEVEEALVAELAAETAGRAGSLPLMQFALTRAWDERSGSTVSLADYERLRQPSAGSAGTAKRSAHLGGVLVGDGQTEPGAAPAAGFVADGKSFEQPLEIGRGNTRAPIGNNNDDGSGFLFGRDFDFSTLGVYTSIVEKIPDDSFEPAPVNVDCHVVHPTEQASRRQSIGNHRLQELPEVDPFGMSLLGTRLESRYFEQVVDETAHPRNIVHQQLGDPSAVTRQVFEMCLDQRGLIDQSGQRCSQFVGNVGDEPALPGPGVFEAANGFLQRAGHTIESVCPSTEFVAGGGVEAHREIASGHLEGRFAGLSYRSKDLPGCPIACPGAEQNEYDPAGEQSLAQPFEPVLDVVCRMEEEEIGTRRRPAPCGDQERPAVHLDPLVTDVALGDYRREIARDQIGSAQERRSGEEWVTVSEVDVYVDIAAQSEGVREWAGLVFRRGWVTVQPLGGEHGQVEIRSLHSILHELSPQRATDEEVGADAENDDGSGDQNDEGSYQPGPDAAPCLHDPARYPTPRTVRIKVG